MYRFGVNGGKRLAWFPSSSGYVTGSIQMKAGLAQGLSWQASANAEPDRCVCVCIRSVHSFTGSVVIVFRSVLFNVLINLINLGATLL